MYSLIITNDRNAWERARHRLSMQRYLNDDDHTHPSIRADFATLSAEVIRRLCSLPTLFMYELEVNRPGFLGSITGVTGNQSQIEITFRVDRRTPIEWQHVDYLTAELGIIDREERKTTHWAIKDVDLRSVLEQARPGLILPSSPTPRPSEAPLSSHGVAERSPVPSSIASSEHDYASLSILFLDIAGWSRLDASDIKLFVKVSMPEIDKLLVQASMKNTWGDAIIATFNTERTAAETALRIRDFFRQATKDKVPAGLKARVSLHRGAILHLYNPIRQEMDIFGQAVHLAARLEPKTPIDDVYCTKAIADALEELRGLGPAAYYQGTVELPKAFGTCEVYSVRWPNEIPPPIIFGASAGDSVTASPRPNPGDATAESPTTATAHSSANATDPQRRSMGLFPNPSNERDTRDSRAKSLVGDVAESERYVAVAPYGTDAGGLGLTLEALVKGTQDLHVSPVSGGHRFPPMGGKGKRLQTGLLWEDSPKGIRLAVGTDGSLALRYRLYNDQLGENAQRGDIGLCATLELLHGAIRYSILLQEQISLHMRPALWSFRLEFKGIESRKLRHDPPQPLRTGPAWTDTDPCSVREIAIAGFYGNEVSASTLGQRLDDVANALATYFSIENTVRLMKAGSRVAGVIS